MSINPIKSTGIISDQLISDAIINNEFQGFKEDYLVIHCLLKLHQSKIKRFLEIGTNVGTGAKIIKNALGDHAVVYSLDLPTELAHISHQHPIMEGKGDNVGVRCELPFIQLRGDSLKFNYSSIYPIDGWYIDGEHNYDNPFHESKEAIKSNAHLIIWHDSDIPDVFNAITSAFKGNKQYNLFRVTDTRILYAQKK